MDFREALNAVSDVIINRPAPIREFDQIYMKAADMLVQAEHVSRHVNDRRIVFIGDGDAISLCLVHLQSVEQFVVGPKEVLVLDFDERIVNSINRFAYHHDLSGKISARQYNVADALPPDIWASFDAFYSNPPFGQSNGGTSIEAFVNRGLEATSKDAVGCLVIADDDSFAWTQNVLQSVQRYALDHGCIITEMIPKLHKYHLDDAPELTSCSLVMRKLECILTEYSSLPLPVEDRQNFYGADSPLIVKYVKDLTDGGKYPTRGYTLEPFPNEE